MFTSREAFFEQNIRDGKRLSIRPALITAPDGTEVPAVAAFNGYYMKFCIPADDALRIANDIADAVEHHDGRASR